MPTTNSVSAMAGIARSVYRSVLVSGRKICRSTQSSIIEAPFGLQQIGSNNLELEVAGCTHMFSQLHTQNQSSSQCLLDVRHYGSIAGDDGRRHEGLVWGYRCSSVALSPLNKNPFIVGGVRYKQNKSMQAAKRASRKKKAKQVRNKLRQMKLAKKLRKATMTPEETLVWRIERLRKKIAVHEQQLKKYELPDFPERDPDPEIVTPEQLYALKKLGYKNKNYVPVGRRGIYGGTIQNMHMHWKKHETVRIDCANFDKGVIKEMGEQLERLSGGTVIDIHQAKTIIMWRGRNYKRPKIDIPEVFKNFNKRKALLKSKHLQSIGSLEDSISKWEKELREVRANMAQEAAERAKWEEENPGLTNPEPAPRAPLAYDSDDLSEMSDMDDEIVSVNDLGPECGSDFDDSDEYTSEDKSIIDSDDEYTSEDDSIIDSDEDIGIESSKLGSDIESDDEHDVKTRSTSQRNAASSAKGNTWEPSKNWSNSYSRGEESDDVQIANSRGRV